MTSPTDLLDLLITGIDRVLPDAQEVRRTLHRRPELGGEEDATRGTLQSLLDWLTWRPVAGTGMYGRLGPAGPAVGLRAELDALPITEATGVEWASQRRGIMQTGLHGHFFRRPNRPRFSRGRDTTSPA